MFAVIQLTASPTFAAEEVVSEDIVAQIDSRITAGQLDQAATLARHADDGVDTGVDLTLPLARLARSLQQSGQIGDAAEFYHRSVQASTRPPARGLPDQKVILVRLAAATVLAQAGQFSNGIEAVAWTLSADSPASKSQKQLGVKLCLRIGSAAFAAADPKTAYRAYTLASQHAVGDDQPIAMLGAAWALAVDGDQPVPAAQQLAAFIEEYPNHPDASRAARACAACLKQAGRAEDANTMLADLLRRWPTSDAAVEVVLHQPDPQSDGEEIAPPIARWLVSPAALERLASLDAKTIRQGMILSADLADSNVWNAYVVQLARIDDSGQITSDLLQQLTETGRDAQAERIAAQFIAPASDFEIKPSAREASCRWAGRLQKWSMLALASESESPETDVVTRTMSVERLFAEALMQTGRTAEAQVWWNHLVDDEGAGDFATLLRCAETETSLGSDITLAAKRIDAARSVAAENRFRLALVDLLDAELAIRRMKFDIARDLLERVVRSSETDAALRGRAQWLIGETYYLQQQFSEAIEAYRRVEGIDSNGMWVAASLIQAGKSFEQLGRTREAAVCYWGLVNRFAESPHAGMARRRLAAISPDQGSPNNSSSEIFRR